MQTLKAGGVQPYSWMRIKPFLKIIPRGKCYTSIRGGSVNNASDCRGQGPRFQSLTELTVDTLVVK